MRTQNDWKNFANFCNEKTSGKFDVNNISAKELNKFLYLPRHPQTRFNFQKSIQQYLGEKKLPFNILKDGDFSRPREVLL